MANCRAMLKLANPRHLFPLLGTADNFRMANANELFKLLTVSYAVCAQAWVRLAWGALIHLADVSQAFATWFVTGANREVKERSKGTQTIRGPTWNL